MTAQDEFDKTYITSSEICRRLNITRATITAGRRRGMLPDPIRVEDSLILIWKRDYVEPFIDAWDINLKSRRGELVK